MITAVILAAGSGKRMGTGVPKQFLLLRGKPLFVCALEAFRPLVDRLILVTREADEEPCREALVKAGLTDVRVVAGGQSRSESSFAGLKAMQDVASPEDIVLIHDAARPFVTEQVIQNVIDGVKTHGAAVAAVPVKDTIKITDGEGRIQKTPERKTLYAAQTPQGFTYGRILTAYEALPPGTNVTDDSEVVEMASQGPVFLVEGDYANQKITTPDDLRYFGR